MDITEYYNNARRRVLCASNSPHLGLRNSFKQLVGEHALHFVDFLVADREKDKRRQLTTWVKINTVNQDWLQLICPVLHENNESFYNASRKLINTYSNVIGDFIIDSNSLHSEKVQHIAKLEGDFYAALVDSDKRESTRKQWITYTHAIGTMIYDHDIHGSKSQQFKYSAATCIYAGQLLGAWLDTSI